LFYDKINDDDDDDDDDLLQRGPEAFSENKNGIKLHIFINHLNFKPFQLINLRQLFKDLRLTPTSFIVVRGNVLVHVFN